MPHGKQEYMPRGDPFTSLCQLSASLSRRVAADLHLHTTASDGDYTPSQIVAFAKAARLDAIALTDHDTFAGVIESPDITVIPGVELTCEWDGREVHVLAYFRSVPSSFQAVLQSLLDRRRDRFRDFVRLARDAGATLDDSRVSLVEERTASLGRRHVAALLVQTGVVRTAREAWQRFVGPLGRQVIPKRMLPLGEAAMLVRAAGGLSSLTHPSPDLSESDLVRLKSLGADGVEAIFPSAGVGRRTELSRWADAVGLIVTGGSDCHGPESADRLGVVGLAEDRWRQFGKAFGLGKPQAPPPVLPAGADERR